MVSRRIGRTVLSREINAALADFGIPVLTAGTTQRIAYAEAMTAGSTVLDHPASAAAAEIVAILHKIEGTAPCAALSSLPARMT